MAIAEEQPASARSPGVDVPLATPDAPSAALVAPQRSLRHVERKQQAPQHVAVGFCLLAVRVVQHAVPIPRTGPLVLRKGLCEPEAIECTGGDRSREVRWAFLRM